MSGLPGRLALPLLVALMGDGSLTLRALGHRGTPWPGEVQARSRRRNDRITRSITFYDADGARHHRTFHYSTAAPAKGYKRAPWDPKGRTLVRADRATP